MRHFVLIFIFALANIHAPTWAFATEASVHPDSAERKEPSDDQASESLAAQALKLGHQGLTAFQNEQFDQAFVEFGRAESLMHSPVFVLYQGRAAEHLGHLLQARDLFKRASNESLTNSSPTTWHDAVGDARRRLALVELRIPRVELRIQGDVELPLTVNVAGREERISAMSTVREEEPGEYEIHIRDALGQKLTQIWLAEEGERRVVIAFVFKMRAQPASPTRENLAISRKIRMSSSRKGAYAAFATGGIGVVLGAVFGGIALSQAHLVKESCQGTSCLPEHEKIAANAGTWAQLSTVSFSVGVVGAAAGTALFFADPSKTVALSNAPTSSNAVTSSSIAASSNIAASSATPLSERIRMQVDIAGNGVRLSGHF